MIPVLCVSFYYFHIYLFNSLFIYLLPYLFTFLRISPFSFQAGGHKKRPNLACLRQSGVTAGNKPQPERWMEC